MSATAPQETRVQCQHDGCGAPERLVDGESGYCYSHDPQHEEARRRASQLGGTRTALRWKRGISPEELGELKSPSDAARWAGIIAAAVAAGRISASAGNAVRALLAEWRSAHDAASLEDEVARLRQQLRGVAR